MIKSIKNIKGQAVVEFAMILPILMLILLGILEFGRFYNAWLMVSQASREGARVAALGGTTTQVENRVDEVMTAYNLARLTVNITPLGARSRGDMVKVVVTYDIDPITPMIGTFTGGTLSLNSQTVMRTE